MVEPEQLKQLNFAKLNSLLRNTFPPAQYTDKSTNSAVILESGERSFAYITSASVSSLSVALTLVDPNMNLNLVLDAEDIEIAQQILGLKTQCTLWTVDKDSLSQHSPISPLQISTKVSVSNEILEILERTHCDVLTEHGIVKAYVKGLEVAQVLEDENKVGHLQVGVGIYDQEAHKLIDPTTQVEMKLQKIIDEILKYRNKNSIPHPLNRVARAKWLIYELAQAHEDYGLENFQVIPSPIGSKKISENFPAFATARAGAKFILSVSYVGADLNAVPAAAQLLSATSADEIWFFHPPMDNHKAIQRQAEHLQVPAKFIPINEPWPKIN